MSPPEEEEGEEEVKAPEVMEPHDPSFGAGVSGFLFVALYSAFYDFEKRGVHRVKQYNERINDVPANANLVVNLS